MAKHMTPENMARAILNSLMDNLTDDDFEVLSQIREAQSYEDAGILTREQGLVIKGRDGWELQITVHPSRCGVETVSCPSCGAEYDDDGDEIGDDGYCTGCRTDDGGEDPDDAETPAPSREARRAARYDELKHLPKDELLAILSQKMRIHALTTRDSKGDILSAIVNAEIPEPRTRSR